MSHTVERLRWLGEAHPERRVEPWLMDEAGVGEKERICHRWWLKGRRRRRHCP
ncbi:MAG: hypothetical protein IPK66_18245 [Rhodospirillales bacterium]|nr:hypothetical protein [Rhodospirillales bacterium]